MGRVGGGGGWQGRRLTYNFPGRISFAALLLLSGFGKAQGFFFGGGGEGDGGMGGWYQLATKLYVNLS